MKKKIPLSVESPETPAGRPYGELAEVIAQIASMPPDQRSLIIGLFGPWGSGKAYLLHVVLQAAERAGIPKRHLLRFNALRIGVENLNEGFFFRELASSLGLLAGTTAIDSAIGSLRKYADALSDAGRLAERILEACKRVTDIISLAGVGSLAFVKSQELKLLILITAIALHAIGPTLFGTAWAARVAGRLMDRLNASRESIVKLRRKIDGHLSQVREPILVAMEDFDLLSPEKARTLLIWLKDNGHFANVTYLLPADKETVAAALGQRDLETGSLMLEKIVSVSIHLPGYAPAKNISSE